MVKNKKMLENLIFWIKINVSSKALSKEFRKYKNWNYILHYFNQVS